MSRAGLRSGTTGENQSYSLWAHDNNTQILGSVNLALNPKIFPNLKVGDTIEMCPVSKPSQKLFFQVELLTTAKRKFRTVNTYSKATMKISIKDTLLALFSLSREDVFIRKVEVSEAALDFVTVSIKDQFLGRPEMFRVKETITGVCVFQNQSIQIGPLHVVVKELERKERRASTGVITKQTRVIFRSRSAEFLVFIQYVVKEYHITNIV